MPTQPSSDIQPPSGNPNNEEQTNKQTNKPPSEATMSRTQHLPPSDEKAWVYVAVVHCARVPAEPRCAAVDEAEWVHAEKPAVATDDDEEEEKEEKEKEDEEKEEEEKEEEEKEEEEEEFAVVCGGGGEEGEEGTWDGADPVEELEERARGVLLGWLRERG